MWNDQIILAMQTFIDDCQLITAPRYCDHRGMFSILFDAQSYQTRFQFTLQQINEVYSNYGVIRGLHAQRSPWAQAKIIQVLEGEIFDVAVDARKNSLQQGKVTQIYLTSETNTQFFIPKGFFHGYAVLSEKALVRYYVDKPYAPDHEVILQYSDPDLNIKWPIPNDQQILSQKDLQGCSWQDIVTRMI